MLAEDRRQAGFTVGQVAWQIGVSPAVYRELEAGTRSPDWVTYDRICKLQGVAADVRPLITRRRS